MYEGPKFTCSKCGAQESKVVDSRPLLSGSTEGIRRRRECLACRERFSTLERVTSFSVTTPSSGVRLGPR